MGRTVRDDENGRVAHIVPCFKDAIDTMNTDNGERFGSRCVLRMSARCEKCEDYNKGKPSDAHGTGLRV